MARIAPDIEGIIRRQPNEEGKVMDKLDRAALGALMTNVTALINQAELDIVAASKRYDELKALMNIIMNITQLPPVDDPLKERTGLAVLIHEG
jgi:hypothetical protein